MLIFIAAVTLSSCQKVINLQLDSTSPQIVIQGNIYNESGPYTVTISKTVNFDQSNVYPPVSGALVIISDDHGMSDTLIEKTKGTYLTSKLRGIAGYTYHLTVKTGNASFTSSSTMPEAVDIDSIYTENSFMDNKVVNVEFMDRANVENYYRIIEFKDSKKIEGFNVVSDDLYNGKKITYKLISMGNSTDSKISTGDYVTIWLEAIDKGAYEYFRTAGQDGSQSASPSNPTSNISNGALGYFNACSVIKKSITVPK